jgi:DNA-binding CsgD family transcriptional regulator
MSRLSFSLKSLLKKTGLERPAGTISFDSAVYFPIRQIALRENRSEAEVAAELLSEALIGRQETDYYLGKWSHLTPREQEITALVVRGYTNNEIGYKLVISPETVKTHISHVLAKFELRSKSELRALLAAWDFSAWDK